MDNGVISKLIYFMLADVASSMLIYYKQSIDFVEFYFIEIGHYNLTNFMSME
jgi:hypothetical protein